MQGENIALTPFILGDKYTRTEIAAAGNVTLPIGPRDPYWSKGIVTFDNAILLMVTLQKKNLDFDYRDYFDGTLFWWQSQNQQRQTSPALKAIASKTLPVLLFVRMKEKTRFAYAGELEFQDMWDDKPVTVKFQSLDFLGSAAPEQLRAIYEWLPDAEVKGDDQLRHDEIEERLARGQGPQSNTKLRRAVEKYAMDRAKEHYKHQGYTTVKDTSKNRPFDLECHRKGVVRRVEVKGTQSKGLTVLVTTGEVKAARNPSVTTDLFVVHSIIAKNVSTEPILSGGRVRLVPDWQPKESDLTPTVYRCTIK